MAAAHLNETISSGSRVAASRVTVVALFIAALVALEALNCLLHARVLKLPYFWDEAGYFVPAARDWLLSGDPIPHSLPSNAHPPLVMAWLVAVWRIFGFSPIVTRIAILMVSSLGLLAAYRLGSILGDRITGLGTALCVALYPVYFAQGSLAQLDLAAAALTMWALADYLEGKIKRSAIVFSLAVLAKETAVVAPFALLALEALPLLVPLKFWRKIRRPAEISWVLLCPCVVLSLWFAYHYWRTGTVFGNTDYFHYNVSETLNPRRAVAALLIQVWHAFAYMNLFVLTVPALCVWLFRRGARDLRTHSGPLVSVCLAYVVALSWVGGAALARYMLPATSVVIALSIAVLRAGLHVRWWSLAVAVAAAVFAMTLNSYPPYHFALDDNLAYCDFIDLQVKGVRFLQESADGEPVLTAWPASYELSQPFLGYTSRSLRTLTVPDFEPAALARASNKGGFQTAFVFSLRYEPQNSVFRPGRYLRGLAFWNRARAEFFDQPPNLTSEAAANLLDGDIVWRETRGPLYAAVIKKKAIQDHPQHR